MNENDLIRLRHMLDAAYEVRAFLEGQTRESLDEDVMRVRALEKSTEIIGEAASKMSQEFQVNNPQIPWAQIVGMRNRLIHGYFDVNLDRLWETVTESIPELILQLEALIRPENPNET